MALLLMLGSCAKSSDEREALAQRVNEIYTEAFGCYEKMDSLANAGVDTLAANGLDAKFCTQDWNTLVARVNDWDNQHNEGMMGFFDGYDGIVLNAGAFTHTSIARHDCSRSLKGPVIEVHAALPKMETDSKWPVAGNMSIIPAF